MESHANDLLATAGLSTSVQHVNPQILKFLDVPVVGQIENRGQAGHVDIVLANIVTIGSSESHRSASSDGFSASEPPAEASQRIDEIEMD